jgi:hypothetical protein
MYDYGAHVSRCCGIAEQTFQHCKTACCRNRVRSSSDWVCRCIRQHVFLSNTSNGDFFLTADNFKPALLRWGDVAFAEKQIDKCFSGYRTLLSESNLVPEQSLLHGGVALGEWGLYLHTTGLSHGRDTLAALHSEAGLTYRTAQATLDACQILWMRKRGDKTRNMFFADAGERTLLMQMSYLLTCNTSDVSPEEILSELPSVDELIDMLMCFSTCSGQY